MSSPLDVQGLRIACQNERMLEQEFHKIPRCNLERDRMVPGSRHKNRYVDVLPNEGTRVPLKYIAEGTISGVDDGVEGDISTYINANFTSGYNGAPKRFIAAMGPLEQTCFDFWRMIVEQDVRIISMMTGLVEKNRTKCHNYWPTTEGQTLSFYYLNVTLMDSIDFDQYIVSTLEVEDTRTQEKRSVFHYWFTSWPDHGVPDQTHPVLDFVLSIRRKQKQLQSTSPILVHCSAGIGRTGTYIAIDIGIDELHNEWRAVDIRRTLTKLREERGGSIQTFPQYLFVYQALRDFATVGNPVTMFGDHKPRDVALIRNPGESFGFTLRGSFPAFILTVSSGGLAASNGLRPGDHVLAVNGNDVSKLKHEEVVKQVKEAGDIINLTVISKELV